MTAKYHHGNLRAALIEGGLKMLTRDGLASFSMRKLATELGVSHAAAYRHFHSKEELLKVILIESSERFNSALKKSVPEGDTSADALYRLGVTYVLFLVENPEILALFNLNSNTAQLLQALFEKDIKSDEPSPCSHFDWDTKKCTEADDSFSLLSTIALPFRAFDQYKHLSDREILLGFWGKAHGIASILISQKNFIPHNELRQAVERVMKTQF